MGHTIGIIGLGNMGSTILSSLLTSKDNAQFYDYFIYDVLKEKMDKFKENSNVKKCNTLNELVSSSNDILIAVKPQQMEKLLTDLKSLNLEKKNIITIAAGLRIDFYKKILGEHVSITRVMPNTPYLVGEGAAAITFDERLSDEDKERIKWIFEQAGKTIICEEEYLDVVTGLSGSGPAYIFIVIEALADGAVRMGLNRKQAYTLAAQMVLGSAKMVLELGKHPGELKDMVTSPGGTTIEAIRVLEKNNVRSAFIEAVIAATEKSKSFK